MPRDYRQKNIERYGIKVAEYDLMFKNQNGLCAACKKPETSIVRGRVRNMSIDHSHKTGKVRALLCNACNVIVGLCKEDVNILLLIIQYIRKHP